MDEEKEKCCNDSAEGCCQAGNSIASSNTLNIGDVFSSGATITYSTGLYYAPDYQSKPSKMKDIVIKQMDYGYLVKIGCQTLCIETEKKLRKALKKYMKDPDGVEQLHMQGEFMEYLD